MIAIDKNDPPIGIDEIKASFMRRPDIMALSLGNRAAAWEHKKALITRFWSHFDGVVAPEWRRPT